MSFKRLCKSWYFVSIVVAVLTFILALSFGVSVKLALLIAFVSLIVAFSLNPDWIYLRFAWGSFSLLSFLNSWTLKLAGSLNFINFDFEKTGLNTSEFIALLVFTSLCLILHYYNKETKDKPLGKLTPKSEKETKERGEKVENSDLSKPSDGYGEPKEDAKSIKVQKYLGIVKVLIDDENIGSARKVIDDLFNDLENNWIEKE